MRRITILFGILFFIFVAIIFFQVNVRSINNFTQKPVSSKVTINSAAFQVELAKTTEERIKGLSGRENLAKNAGMLFLFVKPSYYTFWMHSMKFPLDMIFILNDKVVGVYENLQPASTNDDNPPQYGSNVISDLVLEINAGEAEKNKIKVGDAVAIELNNIPN